mgnify:CR=1 FL=1|jgi:lipid A 3-O-deacylase
MIDVEFLMQKTTTTKRWALTLAGLVLAGAGSVAMAQSGPAGTNGGIGVKYGQGDNYSRTSLSYETPRFWTYDLGGNWGRLDLVGEGSVSYWKADGSRQPSHVWQLSAMPFLRWWVSERFFIEGGVGVTAFSHTRFADETISTAFQFGDQIGVGFQMTQNSRLGLRYAHFSNASIKRPNPGLDVVELGYTYTF